MRFSHLFLKWPNLYFSTQYHIRICQPSSSHSKLMQIYGWYGSWIECKSEYATFGYIQNEARPTYIDLNLRLWDLFQSNLLEDIAIRMIMRQAFFEAMNYSSSRKWAMRDVSTGLDTWSDNTLSGHEWTHFKCFSIIIINWSRAE